MSAEEVAERAGITVANCVYVDDSIDNLDTAKRLGMATVLIGPSGAEARARGHQHATDLRGLLTRRREMDDAKQKEEYERAARLRDQIRELEKKMRPPAGEGQGVA